VPRQVSDLDERFTTIQESKRDRKFLREYVSHPRIRCVSASNPNDLWWRTVSFHEIYEIAVLCNDDDIRVSGGVKDLAVFSIPETQVSDGSDFEFEFRESQTANEGESCASSQIFQAARTG
jgi:hypothetical protein